MTSFLLSLEQLGAWGWTFWVLPTLVWSVLAALMLFVLRFVRMHPHMRLVTYVSVALALPAGLILSSLMPWLLPQALLSLNEQWISGLMYSLEPDVEIRATTMLSENTLALTETPRTAFQTLNLLLGGLSLAMLFGIVIGLLRYALASYQLHREVRQRYAPYAGEAYSSDSVEVWVTKDAEPPFTFGVIRPKICLPSSVLQHPATLQMVMQHELGHIARKDYLISSLLFGVKHVFFWNPLIHYFYEHALFEMEVLSDADALHATQTTPKAYASMLLELCMHHHHTNAIKLSMASTTHLLKKRIMELQTQSAPQKRTMALRYVLTTLLITGIVACSGYQDRAQLNETPITIPSQYAYLINGIPQTISSNLTDASQAPAHAKFYVTSQLYGTFFFSAMPFEHASKAGYIDKQELKMTVNSFEVVIQSNESLSEERVAIYATHVPSFFQEVSTFGIAHSGALENGKPIPLHMKVDPSEIAETAEVMPMMHGGNAAIYRYIEYPEMARKAGLEGKVFIQFLVLEDGRVANPTIVRSANPILDQAALAALHQVTFTPAKNEGKPVKVLMTQMINFKLTN